MLNKSIPSALKMDIKKNECEFQIKLTYGRTEASLKLGNISVFFIKSVFPSSKQELINKILLASNVPTVIPGRGSDLEIKKEGKFVKLKVIQTSGKKLSCEASLDEIEVFLFCNALKAIVLEGS